MSRDDWLGTFWVAVCIMAIGGTIFFAALGFHFLGGEGIAFGIGGWVTFITGLVAAVAFHRYSHAGRRGE